MWPLRFSQSVRRCYKSPRAESYKQDKGLRWPRQNRPARHSRQTHPKHTLRFSSLPPPVSFCCIRRILRRIRRQPRKPAIWGCILSGHGIQTGSYSLHLGYFIRKSPGEESYDHGRGPDAPCFRLQVRSIPLPLKQPDDLTMLVDVDGFGCRVLRQARHGHNVAGDRHHEPGSIGQPDFPDVQMMTSRRAPCGGVRGK